MSALVFVLYLAAVAALAWALFILPQRRRARQLERMLETLKAGDEVVTAGGIFGVVRGFNQGTIMLEVTQGMEIKVATRAVARILDSEPSDTET